METVIPVVKFRSGDALKWSTLPSQLNENICVCANFHMELCFWLHTSSRKCYNNKVYYIIDGFGRSLGEVVVWLCASTLSKTSHGGQQVEDLPTDLLWAAAGYYRSATAKVALRWFGKRSKRSFKIYTYLISKWIAITFYIIQLNWLCQNYNLVSLRHWEVPVA